VAHHGGRVRIVQLVFDGGRQDYFFEQRRKNVDIPNQKQVINWAGVGDDKVHSSKT